VRAGARAGSNVGTRRRSRNDTMIKLYRFPKVNAVARGHTRDLRVLWALEEMQLPFELAGMDHPSTRAL
jgi:glutathione S-transferase